MGHLKNAVALDGFSNFDFVKYAGNTMPHAKGGGSATGDQDAKNEFSTTDGHGL